jgi:hypothetical protein
VGVESLVVVRDMQERIPALDDVRADCERL